MELSDQQLIAEAIETNPRQRRKDRTLGGLEAQRHSDDSSPLRPGEIRASAGGVGGNATHRNKPRLERTTHSRAEGRTAPDST